MPKNGTMICPRCGTPMNRHAAKVFEPRTAAEARLAESPLGGVVAEVHQCPGCGALGARRLHGSRQ